MTQERFGVEHLANESRYVLLDREADGGAKEIGEEVYVDVIDGGVTERVFHHTGVAEEYGGQGLAAVLVRSAVEQAVSDGHKIVPVCPYVVTWFKKNPEFGEHEVKARPEHLRAIR